MTSDLVLAAHGVAAQRRSAPAARPGMLWAASGEGRTTGSVPGRRGLWNGLRQAAGLPLDALDALPAVRGLVRPVR